MLFKTVKFLIVMLVVLGIFPSCHFESLPEPVTRTSYTIEDEQVQNKYFTVVNLYSPFDSLTLVSYFWKKVELNPNTKKLVLSFFNEDYQMYCELRVFTHLENLKNGDYKTVAELGALDTGKVFVDFKRYEDDYYTVAEEYVSIEQVGTNQFQHIRFDNEFDLLVFDINGYDPIKQKPVRLKGRFKLKR